MNIIKWNEVYDTNKQLDKIFCQKYGNTKEIYTKNCIELLVELGEFVNETRVFKYWSVKKIDYDKMLEEYADVLTMCLYFYREFGISIENSYFHIESDNILEVINYLYQKMTLLIDSNDKALIKDIFYNVLYVGELLNLKEEDILMAIKKKQEIIKKRLNSDY